MGKWNIPRHNGSNCCSFCKTEKLCTQEIRRFIFGRPDTRKIQKNVTVEGKQVHAKILFPQRILKKGRIFSYGIEGEPLLTRRQAEMLPSIFSKGRKNANRS